MKRKISFLLFIIPLFCDLIVRAQINFLYNPWFSIANPGHYPSCDYSDYSRDIDQDIASWYNARTVGTLLGRGSPNRNSFPDWMDTFCAGTISGLPYYGNFIFEETNSNSFGSSDAIRQSIKMCMNPNDSYIFKLIYTGVNYKHGWSGTSVTTERIYLTEYTLHWNATWGNVRLSWTMYPPMYNLGGWVEGGMVIPSRLGNVFKDLHNIVIANETGACYISYVELSELCNAGLMIQNHTFHPFINELPYKCSGDLSVGNNVGDRNSPPGDVTVESGANIIFSAVNSIRLEPGFHASTGSEFMAILKPCSETAYGNGMGGLEDSSIIIQDDRRQSLGCDDTVHIVGLDGDTISYKRFWWDFGNGKTSTRKSVDIFYATPGSYTVKLVITDSLDVSDTLSKIYIRPDCANTENLSRINTDNISHNKNSETIMLSPNPSKGYFDIILGNDHVFTSYQVLDQIGRVIIDNNIGTLTKLELNLEVKGIYILRLNSRNCAPITRKLIVD